MSLTLPFPPYEKSAESLAAWLEDDEAAFRAASRVEWIVTEKIHGANFCLVTDGAAVRCARRKGWLSEGEDFFGHGALAAKLRSPVLALFRAAKSRDPQITIAFVYGELFGGGYPHPRVRATPGVSPVQTGVWYSPSIEFCAFDVGVLREGEQERAYLDQERALGLCDQEGIRFAGPLFRGGYEEAWQFPIGFETTIPALLGLPSLGPSNKAEGIVLKPARSIVVPRRDGALRPVVKRKIPEFSEDKRFHGAKKWPEREAGSARDLEWLKQEASGLMNENRLFAAVSKVGQVRAGDSGRLREVLSLLQEDVEADLDARHSAALRGLSSADSSALRRFIEGEARALVEIHLGVAPP